MSQVGTKNKRLTQIVTRENFFALNLIFPPLSENYFTEIKWKKIYSLKFIVVIVSLKRRGRKMSWEKQAENCDGKFDLKLLKLVSSSSSSTPDFLGRDFSCERARVTIWGFWVRRTKIGFSSVSFQTQSKMFEKFVLSRKKTLW